MRELCQLVILVLFLLVKSSLNAQTFSGTITPASACLGQTINVGITSSPINATSYTFATSLGTFVPVSSSVVAITATNCGVQTVTCYAFNGNNLVNTLILTTTLVCPGLTVSPITQTICEGSPASITVSGATSYTWSNGQIGSTIYPTPLVSTTFSVIGDQNGCMATSTVTVKNIALSASSNSVCAGYASTLTAFGSNVYTWTGSTFTGSVNQPSIAVGAGTYTVSIPAGPNTCTSSISVGASQPLIINVSQNSFSTCIVQNLPYAFSKSVSLSATGAQTYSWTGGSIPLTGGSVLVRPTVNTCYTVTGTTAYCSGSAVACVSVIPQFTVGVISTMARFGVYEQVGFLCRLVPSALNIVAISTLATGPSSAFTYIWNLPANVPAVNGVNTPTVTFTPTVSFLYSVEVADANGCISAARQGTAYVAICDFFDTGLQNDEWTNALFEVYPNPTKDKLFIRSSEMFGPLTIQVTDAAGRILIPQEIESNDLSNPGFIDVSNLERGLYLLNIYSHQKLLQRTKVLRE